MKNLLIYTNPDHKFSAEHDTLTKIQIDNSLSLGWKREDILLVTNFDYEYQGVKAIVVDYYKVTDQDRSTKIPAINQLFAKGIIQNDLYWFHDHDAFQIEPIDIQLTTDAGFTNHGYKTTWNAGSFFFTKNAKDIFLDIWDNMHLRKTNEQDALTYMWDHNLNGINTRYQLLNMAYNIGIYHIEGNLKASGMPAKVVHFHPHKRRHYELFRHLLPDRLLAIFNKHGICVAF